MLCDDAEQIDRIAVAVGEAPGNMTPVVIGVGSGDESTLTFNRTIIWRCSPKWAAT